jgi:D-alanyl-D-alanine carboxypeptidase/D-alanyl-D-alanine-endopeptidase (penicillin-binding protein 4)
MRSRALTRWGPVVLVLAVLAGAVASYEWDLGARWFGLGTTTPPASGPLAVPAPTGIDLPAPASPAPVAAPVALSADGRLSRAKVARLLAPLVADPDLGPHVVVAVADLSAGTVVYQHGVSMRPASTTKLLTTTAALSVLGADHRFRTDVVLEGHGTRRRLVLVGGGDPYLASKPAAQGDDAYPHRADLRTLARKTASTLAGKGIRAVRLAYDDSLFSGPDAAARWEPSYLSRGVVSRIRALWADEGRPADGTGHVPDPSLTAATHFAAELRAAGVEVVGPPAHATAAAGAKPVAHVESAPLDEIVERVLQVSDNEAAEVLAHQVGLAVTGSGSFAGGVAGLRKTLAGLGIPLTGDRLYDGSGLSRDDRLSPVTLLAVLRLVASGDHPELRAVLSGLPVAGFSGSLADRFDEVPAADRGRVRAKTGTLRATSALAGIATDQDGTSVAFVVGADRIPLLHTTAGQDAVDAIAAALAGCRCSH